MNDYDKLISIINGKVNFKLLNKNDIKNYNKNVLPVDVSLTDKAELGVEVRNSSLMGYAGFVGVWLFDDKGNFLSVGHYE